MGKTKRKRLSSESADFRWSGLTAFNAARKKPAVEVPATLNDEEQQHQNISNVSSSLTRKAAFEEKFEPWATANPVKAAMGLRWWLVDQGACTCTCPGCGKRPTTTGPVRRNMFDKGGVLHTADAQRTEAEAHGLGKGLKGKKALDAAKVTLVESHAFMLTQQDPLFEETETPPEPAAPASPTAATSPRPDRDGHVRLRDKRDLPSPAAAAVVVSPQPSGATREKRARRHLLEGAAAGDSDSENEFTFVERRLPGPNKPALLPRWRNDQALYVKSAKAVLGANLFQFGPYSASLGRGLCLKRSNYDALAKVMFYASQMLANKYIEWGKAMVTKVHAEDRSGLRPELARQAWPTFAHAGRTFAAAGVLVEWGGLEDAAGEDSKFMMGDHNKDEDPLGDDSDEEGA